MGLKGTPSSDRVAIAALANLVRLLCAELVAGRHRDDIELLENAVRAKLNISVPGASANDLAAGLRLAHEILGPILARVREQALEVRADDSTTGVPRTSPKKSFSLLN
ncbi:MAG: hypothetical protein P4L81_02905 [Candidatus Pacebacteria bacterium]|nr:hypothetical protein [Candidatus Paceibacterota bacterium]